MPTLTRRRVAWISLARSAQSGRSVAALSTNPLLDEEEALEHGCHLHSWRLYWPLPASWCQYLTNSEVRHVAIGALRYRPGDCWSNVYRSFSRSFRGVGHQCDTWYREQGYYSQGMSFSIHSPTIFADGFRSIWALLSWTIWLFGC